jgi:TRAP-type C4-dicarboxylate transport system substrate-binding protein
MGNRILAGIINIWLFFLLIVSMSLIPGTCDGSDKYVLKAFTPSPPAMPLGHVYEWMSEELNKKTQGQLTIKVYYSGQLPYGTPDALNVLRSGKLDIVDVWDIHVVGTADWMGVRPTP